MKAQVTVATGGQSWLGRSFSVDALNMLERFDAEAAAQWHECIRIQLIKRLEAIMAPRQTRCGRSRACDTF
jgi:hypothetical protein